MKYTNLGASGLQVSRPCLGAMMFGHGADASTSEPDSHRIIDACLALAPALIKRLSDASRWAR